MKGSTHVAVQEAPGERVGPGLCDLQTPTGVRHAVQLHRVPGGPLKGGVVCRVTDVLGSPIGNGVHRLHKLRVHLTFLCGGRGGGGEGGRKEGKGEKKGEERRE